MPHHDVISECEQLSLYEQEAGGILHTPQAEYWNTSAKCYYLFLFFVFFLFYPKCDSLTFWWEVENQSTFVTLRKITSVYFLNTDGSSFHNFLLMRKENDQ